MLFIFTIMCTKSSFPLYNTMLPTIVTKLYIRSLDLIHLITKSLYGTTNLYFPHSHTAEPRLRTERGRKIAVSTSFSSIESRPHLSSPLEFPRESTRRRCAFLGQETLLSFFGDTLSQDCPTPRTHGVRANWLRSALLALSRMKPTGKRAVLSWGPWCLSLVTWSDTSLSFSKQSYSNSLHVKDLNLISLSCK